MPRTEIHPTEQGKEWLVRTTVRNTEYLRTIAGARAKPRTQNGSLQPSVAEWYIPATAEVAKQLRNTIPKARWTKVAATERRELAARRSDRLKLQDDKYRVETQVPTPSGTQTLAPFQVAGVEWLTPRSGILADEMGLGKTVQLALACQNRVRMESDTQILVLCPTSAIGVWETHLQEWAGIETFIYHGPRRAKDLEAFEDYQGPKALISSHGLIERHSYQVNYGASGKEGKEGTFNRYWDILVIDEAHKIGVTPGGKRVRATQAISRTADLVWAATGTPVNDNPRDLHILSTYVNPLLFGSYSCFTGRYCITRMDKWDNDVNLGLHPDMEDEYEWVLRPWMLRRLKKTHGKDIPEGLDPQVIHLDMTGPQAKAYREMVNESLALVGQESGATSLLMARGNLPKQGVLQYIAAGVPTVEDGKVVGLQTRNSNKLAYLLDVAKDREGDPFVVYAWSKREIEMYADGLGNAGFTVGKITGSVPRAERDATVKLFQEGKIPILLITNAAADSVTLTAADLMILARPSWRALENDQVMGRINRWGQKREPMVQILVSRGTVDETRLAALAGKVNIQEEITLDKKTLKAYLTGKTD